MKYIKSVNFRNSLQSSRIITLQWAQQWRTEIGRVIVNISFNPPPCPSLLVICHTTGINRLKDDKCEQHSISFLSGYCWLKATAMTHIIPCLFPKWLQHTDTISAGSGLPTRRGHHWREPCTICSLHTCRDSQHREERALLGHVLWQKPLWKPNLFVLGWEASADTTE